MKKRIEDIFQPGIYAVPPDVPATLVMDIMREKNISCIVVTEEEKPIGIFTERDIVRGMMQPSPDFSGTIDQIMTREVRTVTPEMMLYEAFSVLTENLIRHLVVVDREHKALGVLTQSDLLDHFEYNYVEKSCTVSQVMNRGIVTVDPYDSIHRAARTMAEGALSFLIVCRQLQPLGVVTERDMAGFVAAGMDIHNTLIEDVMSAPVHTIGPEQLAFKAAEMMHEFAIRHLVVVGETGKAAGVVTQTDLIRGLKGTFIETLRRVAGEQANELAETERLLAEKTLCLDALLSSAVSTGIAMANRDLQICQLTSSAEFILGITAGEMLGRDIRTLIEHRDLPLGRFEQALARIHDRDTYSFTLQRKNNKQTRIIQATLSGIFAGDTIAGLLLLLDDITEKRLSEDAMHRLAYYDTLTGLANRSMFNDKLKSELARSRRNDTPFAVVLINVDNFRDINTTLSYQAGDRLLRETARRLEGLLRQSDTVSRLDCDQFCILLVSTGTTGDARAVAQKIVQRLAPAYDLDGTTLSLNFSLGVALFPLHGEDEETLLRNAQIAMNQAKTLGRANRESNIVVA